MSYWSFIAEFQWIVGLNQLQNLLAFPAIFGHFGPFVPGLTYVFVFPSLGQVNCQVSWVQPFFLPLDFVDCLTSRHFISNLFFENCSICPPHLHSVPAGLVVVPSGRSSGPPQTRTLPLLFFILHLLSDEN